MPSIHRQPGRPFWFCAFSIFDPQTHKAKRVFRSTKTSDKQQALEICRAWHKVTLKARNGKLSVDAAREVIAQGVSDVFTAANLESLESHIHQIMVRDVAASQVNRGRSNPRMSVTSRIVQRFTEFLGAKAHRDLSTLQANDIARFRDREAKERARATANLSLKGFARVLR